MRDGLAMRTHARCVMTCGGYVLEYRFVIVGRFGVMCESRQHFGAGRARAQRLQHGAMQLSASQWAKRIEHGEACQLVAEYIVPAHEPQHAARGAFVEPRRSAASARFDDPRFNPARRQGSNIQRLASGGRQTGSACKHRIAHRRGYTRAFIG